MRVPAGMTAVVEAMGVGLFVGDGEGVGEDILVGEGVAVGAGVFVRVGVIVGVADRVDVAVAVGVLRVAMCSAAVSAQPAGSACLGRSSSASQSRRAAGGLPSFSNTWARQ